MKRLEKQTITNKNITKSVIDNKAKVMIPLLILTFALILSFTINDVAAANTTSNKVIVPSHNITVNSTVKAVNSLTNIQN